MGTIGIVTLFTFDNYGNRLQNFALQEVVGSLHSNIVRTIDTSFFGTGTTAIYKTLTRLRSDGIASMIPSIQRRVGGMMANTAPPPTSDLAPGRKEAIRRFVENNIDCAIDDFSGLSAATKSAEDYDYLIAGSDQIWNPDHGLRDHFRFLQFASPPQRIAYAGSFGVPSVPKRLEKAYRSGLVGMSHISTREQRAAELVQEISGRRVPVVLDPTMLLEPSVWEALAVVPMSLEGGGYVAEFLLGPAATEDEMDPVVRYAARAGLERIDLKGDALEDLSVMGPLEFVGAIKNASLLVTDSFHAAVFATIFRVPFLLRDRGSMNSRFDTLLSKIRMDKPKWRSINDIEASVDIDWAAVRAHLARERVASLAFLREALSLPAIS